MQKVGINKRLRDRRLELDYSVREASIRLNISRVKLYLIEYGYIKVNSLLKEKFIRKYKLDQRFFDDDFKGYPTLIYNPPKKKKERPKFSKFFKTWTFKVGCLLLMGGFISLSCYGLSNSPRLVNEVPSFFSTRLNELKDYTKSPTGPNEYHSYTEAQTSTLVSDNFYSLSAVYTEDVYNFRYVSVNFFEKDEYMTYNFLRSEALFNIKTESGIDLGNYLFDYEARIVREHPRIYLSIYSADYITAGCLSHISADVDVKTGNIKYNLVEARDFADIMEAVPPDSLEYIIYTYMFEEHWNDLFLATHRMFLEKQAKGEIAITFEDFYSDFVNGVNKLDYYQSLWSKLAIWDLVLAVIFLALFTLSCLKTFKWGIRISEGKVIDEEKEFAIFSNIKAFKKNATDMKKTNAPPKTITVPKSSTRTIPYNNWPFPVVPEIAIRIFVLLIAYASSMCVFFIFQSMLSFDITGAIAGFLFKSEIASLSSIAMILFMFIKLDIRQNKKSYFSSNFFLFFAGLILYIFTIMVQFSLQTTKAFESYNNVLNYLPGNVIWGILAFNCLSATLFSEPKFKTDIKKKTIAFRLLSIVPFSYILVSGIYSIGKSSLGWVWPLPVASLFFNKAFFVTIFAILYLAFVFFYKNYTNKKYGKEAAEIYRNGNRYFFIKNLVVASIIAGICVIDFIIGKVAPNNPFDIGRNYLLIVTIPFILLYHPHMGQRNKKWDIAFHISYGFLMSLGYILIISNLSIYLQSL